MKIQINPKTAAWCMPSGSAWCMPSGFIRRYEEVISTLKSVQEKYEV